MSTVCNNACSLHDDEKLDETFYVEITERRNTRACKMARLNVQSIINRWLLIEASSRLSCFPGLSVIWFSILKAVLLCHLSKDIFERWDRHRHDRGYDQSRYILINDSHRRWNRDMAIIRDIWMYADSIRGLPGTVRLIRSDENPTPRVGKLVNWTVAD